MTPEGRTALATLLDGYLHQDLAVVHGSAAEAARAFARDAGPARAAEAAAAIRAFVDDAMGREQREWQRALRRIGGAWVPASLAEVAALAEALEAAGLSPSADLRSTVAMPSLAGKNALIFGLANDRSIAWGIARALHAEGARLGFSYVGAAIEKRMRPLAESLDAALIAECDVTSDEQIDAFFEQAKAAFGRVDILIHSVAFANREDLERRFHLTDREGFILAHNVSAYSLIGLTRAAKPLMTEGGAVLTLSYYGAEKAVPSYNVMGVAKASLEATVRYLALDLGADGIRVNAISAGPIRTLAASGIRDFRKYLNTFPEVAPLRRNVTIEDVGATAAFLCGPGAAGITGEVVHVDAGFNIVGMRIEE